MKDRLTRQSDDIRVKDCRLERANSMQDASVMLCRNEINNGRRADKESKLNLTQDSSEPLKGCRFP